MTAALAKFLGIWASALVASFLLNGGVFIWALGRSNLWHHLRHPVIKHEAFYFFTATVVVIGGAFLALFFSATVALAAVEEKKQAVDSLLARLGTGWTFLPFLYFCFALNLLVGATWGIPITWHPVAVTVALGPFVLLSMGMMARAAPTLIESND